MCHIPHEAPARSRSCLLATNVNTTKHPSIRMKSKQQLKLDSQQKMLHCTWVMMMCSGPAAGSGRDGAGSGQGSQGKAAPYIQTRPAAESPQSRPSVRTVRLVLHSTGKTRAHNGVLGPCDASRPPACAAGQARQRGTPPLGNEFGSSDEAKQTLCLNICSAARHETKGCAAVPRSPLTMTGPRRRTDVPRPPSAQAISTSPNRQYAHRPQCVRRSRPCCCWPLL